MSSIVKRYEGLKKSQAMTRVRARGVALQHTIVASAAGYAMGSIERRATSPLPTVFGLDPSLTWGGFFAMVATAMSGKAGQAAASISDGLLVSYAYKQGLGTGYTIKGEDEGEEDFDL